LLQRVLVTTQERFIDRAIGVGFALQLDEPYTRVDGTAQLALHLVEGLGQLRLPLARDLNLAGKTGENSVHFLAHLLPDGGSALIENPQLVKGAVVPVLEDSGVDLSELAAKRLERRRSNYIGQCLRAALRASEASPRRAFVLRGHCRAAH
jgi:hypothetical protein